MNEAFEDVRAFHEAFDIPIKRSTGWPEDQRVQLRVDLINEEVRELLEAISQRNLADTADGMADLIYVVIGAAIEFGIPLPEIWNEVQRSNMAKIDPVTGTVNRRDDGKVLKPVGWAPPDIASILRNHGS